MSIILMHTLKSMGKRPVQTAIIVVSVVITAACIVLMLAMPDIFFDCYVLISGRAYGSAQYYFEVVIGDGTKDYHDIFPVLDRAFGDEWCAVIDYGEVAAKTESFNLMCEIYIADDLDRFNSLNGAVPCAALPEEELPEGYAPVCVSEFFTEKSGLSLGDTFSVVPVGNAVVAAVMPDNGHYFSHPYPKLAVQRGLDTVLAPTFSVRVTTPVDRDTALRTADEIAAAGFRVSEHDDVGSYAEDFAEERTAENMPAVLVAGILIIVTMVVLLRLSCTSVVRARSEELVRFKAAGATPAQCMAILLGETTVYTLVGGLVGLGFGKLLIDRLTSGFRIAGAFSFDAEPWTYAVAFLLAFAVGISTAAAASASFASRSATRLLTEKDKPVRAAHPAVPAVFAAATVAFGVAPVFSDGEEIYAFMVLFLCCACLFTATVMPYAVRFLCFLHGKIRGTGTSYIAAQNATAAPFAARTATALALLISFVFTASMLIDVVKVLSSPAQKRFGFDIVVVDDNIQTKADADEAFVKYSAMDGVDAVYVTTKKIIRFIDDHPDTNFHSTLIIGLRNGDDLRRFCKGTDDDTVRRFDDESTDFPVVISYYIADELGLSVGDTYILANAYISPRELTVVGIDYTTSNFDMYIYTRFDVCNTFSPQAPIVYIDAAGATTADFAQYADGNTVLVFDGDNYNMDSTTFSMDGLLSSFGAIIYVAAAMGLVNLIAVSSSERKRERELFRLAGFAPSDSARFHLAEALSSILLGGVAGTVYALAITSVLEPFSRVLGKYVAGYVSAVSLVPVALAACALVLLCQTTFNLAPLALAAVRRKRNAARTRRRKAATN